MVDMNNNEKYLRDIEESEELNGIWESYTQKYPYAEGIKFAGITSILKTIFRKSNMKFNV